MPPRKITPDAEIQLKELIDTLKTKKLGRQGLVLAVCRTLFYDYGIQPGANTVHNLIKQGSMTDIHSDVQLFWSELRELSKVSVNIAGVPEEVTSLFGTQLHALWDKAAEQAHSGFVEAMREIENERLLFNQRQVEAKQTIDVLSETEGQLRSQISSLERQVAELNSKHEQYKAVCEEKSHAENEKINTLQTELKSREEKIGELITTHEQRLQEEIARSQSDKEYLNGQWKATNLQVENERQNLTQARADFQLAIGALERQLQASKLVESQLRSQIQILNKQISEK